MTDQTTTITVPFTIRKRGGRKLILTPDGTPASPPSRARPDNALLKALARGFRWKKMLHEGNYQTLEEIADAENINPSYVSRLLRMTRCNRFRQTGYHKTWNSTANYKGLHMHAAWEAAVLPLNYARDG